DQVRTRDALGHWSSEPSRSGDERPAIRYHQTCIRIGLSHFLIFLQHDDVIDVRRHDVSASKVWLTSPFHQQRHSLRHIDRVQFDAEQRDAMWPANGW